MKKIEINWINIHGAPRDPQFVNKKLKEVVKVFGIYVRPRPASRHQKIRIVERKNTYARLLTPRLLKDVDLLAIIRGEEDGKVGSNDILSRTTFFQTSCTEPRR